MTNAERQKAYRKRHSERTRAARKLEYDNENKKKLVESHNASLGE